MDFAPAANFRRRRARRAALLLAGIFLGLGAMTGAAQQAAVHTVVIEGMQFSPAVVEVHAGDKVIWQNKDPYPHTATSPGAGFDSGEIPASRRWMYIAKKRGSFSYVCSLHPTMQARLVVK